MREVASKQGFVSNASTGKFANKVAVKSDVRPKLEKREVSANEVLEVIMIVMSSSSSLLIIIVIIVRLELPRFWK